MSLPLSFRLLPSPLSIKALQAFRKDAGWPLSSPSDNVKPHPRGNMQWVSVEFNGERIGIARLELAPPEFCYISDLVISSKYRNQGIGHWFLEHIEQYCCDYGVQRLILEAAEGTESFYASLQFVNDTFAPSFLKKEIKSTLRKVFVRHSAR
jgi:GNAT superfamily N-acetyltransferase